MENIVSTDGSVTKQITDSISTNLTDSDLESTQNANIIFTPDCSKSQFLWNSQITWSTIRNRNSIEKYN